MEKDPPCGCKFYAWGGRGMFQDEKNFLINVYIAYEGLCDGRGINFAQGGKILVKSGFRPNWGGIIIGGWL